MINKKPTAGSGLRHSYQFPDTAGHATPLWVLYARPDFFAMPAKLV